MKIQIPNLKQVLSKNTNAEALEATNNFIMSILIKHKKSFVNGKRKDKFFLVEVEMTLEESVTYVVLK
jgi:hypothetical protein